MGQQKIHQEHFQMEMDLSIEVLQVVKEKKEMAKCGMLQVGLCVVCCIEI